MPGAKQRKSRKPKAGNTVGYTKSANIDPFMDERSRRVYEMRIEQEKSFREIGIALGLSRSRAQQLYQVIATRIAVEKGSGSVEPKHCLSARALHAIQRVFGTIDVTKNEVRQALKYGTLHPRRIPHYGLKTHLEICKWADVSRAERKYPKSRPLIGGSEISNHRWVLGTQNNPHIITSACLAIVVRSNLCRIRLA
jgi:hypothetical protein